MVLCGLPSPVGDIREDSQERSGGDPLFYQFTGLPYVLPDNRDLGMTKTPSGGKDRAWTEEEHQLMMEQAIRLDCQDVVLAMKLARLAGLRIHECARLTVGHIQDALKDGEVTIKGKGGLVRRVPVSPELRLELERILAGEWMCQGAQIFSLSRDRKPIRRSRASKSSSGITGEELAIRKSDHTARAAPLICQRRVRTGQSPQHETDQKCQDAGGGAVGTRQAGGDEHLPGRGKK